MVAKDKKPICLKDLSNFKMLRVFERSLEKIIKRRAKKGQLSKTHLDPRRKMTQKAYLSGLLLAMYNPVITSMRALCHVSKIREVQRRVTGSRLSLGSFSEAQAVVDCTLVEEVFNNLVKKHGSKLWGDERLKGQKLMAIDGTLCKALPRMGWAFYRNQGTKQSAVKLHVSFNILKQEPEQVEITDGRTCERAVLQRSLKKGSFYVGDRYYGENYQFFGQLEKAECNYVIRLRNQAVYEVIEEHPIKEEDKAARVIMDGMVILGSKNKDKSQKVRLVIIEKEDGEKILLVTDKTAEQLSGELIGLIYSYRWQIELFFKWIKCILGCRHWFSHSVEGVTLQVYCMLIAAILLFRALGTKPSKRTMEMLAYYEMGWASLEELEAHVEEEQEKLLKKKRM